VKDEWRGDEGEGEVLFWTWYIEGWEKWVYMYNDGQYWMILIFSLFS